MYNMKECENKYLIVYAISYKRDNIFGNKVIDEKITIFKISLN